jgi:predicted sulfurtransferase
LLDCFAPLAMTKKTVYPSESNRLLSMTQEVRMPLSVKQMMETANAAVSKITPQKARELIAKGNTLVVDIRDGTEVAASGKVAGAVHVSRGLLEFRADPEAPTHDKNFTRDKTVLL